MTTKLIARKIIKLEKTISTNTYATDLLKKEKPAEGTVIIAFNQTSGRGNSDNAWESEPGKNLTFSVILYPCFIKPSGQFIFNKAISLGLVDFLKQLNAGLHIKIKWPNDIYVNNEKIAGILIENVISGKEISSSVVGIGLNVNQTVFKSDAPNPVSLKNLLKKEFDLMTNFEKLCLCIENRYLCLKNHDSEKINSDYIDYLYRYQQFSEFIYNNKRIKAKITGISGFGELLLIDENDRKSKCGFKEIEFII